MDEKIKLFDISECTGCPKNKAFMVNGTKL